jgi:hypothetical protein
MWEMSCYRFDIRLDLNIHGALFILAMLSVSAADGLCWNLELASVGTGGWFQWESAAKFTASARFVPSHRVPFLAPDLICNRVQEIGRFWADDTESRSIARPGEAAGVPVTVLRHPGISVDGHRPDQHGQALTLPIAIHQQASSPVGSGDQAPAHKGVARGRQIRHGNRSAGSR